VGINSAAVARPGLLDELAHRFGSQCVVLSVDARRGGQGWEVVVQGGRQPTGLGAVAWIEDGGRRGGGEVVLTGCGRDGRGGRWRDDGRSGGASLRCAGLDSGGGAGGGQRGGFDARLRRPGGGRKNRGNGGGSFLEPLPAGFVEEGRNVWKRFVGGRDGGRL